MNPLRIRLASWILGHTLVENPESWKLVHIQQITDVTFKSEFGIITERGSAYFYLYESNLGNRKYEIACDLTSLNQKELESCHQKWPWFLKTGKLWLAGRFVEKIPSYQDVDSLDVIAKLTMT